MSRSDCPIANTLDYIGDRWSLLVLRDISLYNVRTYSALQNSKEHIASNILNSRLKRLEKSGIILKRPHPNDKRKKLFFLTEKGYDLIPIILEMMIWSKKHSTEHKTPDDFLSAATNNRAELIKEIISMNRRELDAL